MFPSLLQQNHTDKECVNAYLNIPHPKLCKSCLYKLERGKEREGERSTNLTRFWTEGLNIFLRCSCCHDNRLHNTYSLCHSGVKKSDELNPLLSPSENKINPHWPSSSFASSCGSLTPSRDEQLRQIKANPDKIRLIRIKVWEIHYPLPHSTILTPPTITSRCFLRAIRLMDQKKKCVFTLASLLVSAVILCPHISGKSLQSAC